MNYTYPSWCLIALFHEFTFIYFSMKTITTWRKDASDDQMICFPLSSRVSSGCLEMTVSCLRQPTNIDLSIFQSNKFSIYSYNKLFLKKEDKYTYTAFKTHSFNSGIHPFARNIGRCPSATYFAAS